MKLHEIEESGNIGTVSDIWSIIEAFGDGALRAMEENMRHGGRPWGRVFTGRFYRSMGRNDAILHLRSAALTPGATRLELRWKGGAKVSIKAATPARSVYV